MGERPIQSPTGRGPAGRQRRGQQHAAQGRAAGPEEHQPLSSRHQGQDLEQLEGHEGHQEEADHQESGAHPAVQVGFREALRDRGLHAKLRFRPQARERQADPDDQLGTAQDAKQPALRPLDAPALVDEEALGPGHDGFPEKLVQHDHDGEHGQDGVDLGHHVALLRGGGHVGPEPGQPEILALPEGEGLAGHEEEPAVGHAHHGVPDQVRGREGDLQPAQALDPGQAVGPRDFVEAVRQRLQPLVEGEGEIPGLAGDDEDDGGQFQARVAVWEEAHHGQQDHGQEGQEGDALEDVQDGDEDPLRKGILGRPVGHGQAEADGDPQRHGSPHQRKKGVLGQGQGREIDLHHGALDRRPLLGHEDEAHDEADERHDDEKVHPPASAQRDPEQVRGLSPKRVQKVMDHGRSGIRGCSASKAAVLGPVEIAAVVSRYSRYEGGSSTVRLLIDTSFPVVATKAECPGGPQGSTPENGGMRDIHGLGIELSRPWTTSSVVTPSASLS